MKARENLRASHANSTEYETRVATGKKIFEGNNWKHKQQLQGMWENPAWSYLGQGPLLEWHR